jgi:hypothetical protein
MNQRQAWQVLVREMEVPFAPVVAQRHDARVHVRDRHRVARGVGSVHAEVPHTGAGCPTAAARDDVATGDEGTVVELGNIRGRRRLRELRVGRFLQIKRSRSNGERRVPLSEFLIQLVFSNVAGSNGLEGERCRVDCDRSRWMALVARHDDHVFRDLAIKKRVTESECPARSGLLLRLQLRRRRLCVLIHRCIRRLTFADIPLVRRTIGVFRVSCPEQAPARRHRATASTEAASPSRMSGGDVQDRIEAIRRHVHDGAVDVVDEQPQPHIHRRVFFGSCLLVGVENLR